MKDNREYNKTEREYISELSAGEYKDQILFYRTEYITKEERK